MTQHIPTGLALDLFNIAAETGLTEDAVPFDGHVFVARRNAGTLFDHLRFQIFRDEDPTPYGAVEPHWCEYNGDDWRLWVYLPDGRNTVLPTKHAADHPDGGCVATYRNALNHLRMAAEGHHG